LGPLLGQARDAARRGVGGEVIPRFALARPTSIAEAFDAWDAAAGDAAWYAGGTELLQVMKMGLARAGTLIDLKRLPELHGVALDDGTLVIGAGTTHREIEYSDLVRRELPALAALEAHVANVRVRNQGTLGGNLAFAEPHSDPATFLLACGATVTLASTRGERSLPMKDFLVGPFTTAREADELLVSIRVARAAPGEGRGYAKAKFRERPAVSVGVSLRVEAGRVGAATVAVGSMTEAPVLVPEAAGALVGAHASAEGIDAALTEARPHVQAIEAEDDLDGSADYKQHLAGVLLGRAAHAAATEASARA
jgi:carbon-monoxide dehydrogenase medium subunit